MDTATTGTAVDNDTSAEEHLFPVPTGFRVQDEATANWVTRKVIEARAYAERVSAWAEQELRRARRQEEFFLSRFGHELEAWARHQIRARGGRQKSVCLPAGRIGIRLAKARLLVLDEAAALAWARQHHPEAVQTVERLIKAPLTQHLANTGELPAGTTLQPDHEVFFIR